MYRDTEVLKIQILADYWQAKINRAYSLLIAGFVSLLVLLLTIYYQGKVDTLSLTIGSLGLYAILGILGMRYVEKRHVEYLNIVERLLRQIERGESLPPLRKLKEMSGTKETEENKKEKTLSKYEMLVVLLGVVSLVVTALNLGLIYEINKANQEFQNMIYNFPSVIVTNADYAILEKASEIYGYKGTIERTTHYGYLDVEIHVITPHYGTLAIELKKFNLGDSEMLDSEKRDKTKVSYAYENDKYEYPIVSGLNDINDNLHLKALVYPNLYKLPPQGESVQFPLGLLFLEAELFDLQTQETLTQEFSARIVVVMEVFS